MSSHNLAYWVVINLIILHCCGLKTCTCKLITELNSYRIMCNKLNLIMYLTLLSGKELKISSDLSILLFPSVQSLQMSVYQLFISWGKKSFCAWRSWCHFISPALFWVGTQQAKRKNRILSEIQLWEHERVQTGAVHPIWKIWKM